MFCHLVMIETEILSEVVLNALVLLVCKQLLFKAAVYRTSNSSEGLRVVFMISFYLGITLYFVTRNKKQLCSLYQQYII